MNLNKNYVYGCIYEGTYLNWKHDPSPLIFCMYSDPKYTHGLNIHYLSRPDREWLSRTIYLLAKGGQRIDGMTLYKMLKMRRISIIKTCYRMYFTNMCNYKMVSPGLNPELMEGKAPSKDPWVEALNRTLEPGNLDATPKIAFNSEELQERIIQAQNSVSINELTVKQPFQGKQAPWMTGRRY